MKKGFSLVELLVALIIISLITSILTPMLTRKLKRTDVSLSSKAVSTDCTKLDNDNRCMMCTKTTCTLCVTQMSTPEGYYVNPEESCDYKKCIDKFVGCKACNKDFCVTCNKGYGYIEEDKTCLKCSDNCLNCNKTGCLQCAGGFTLQNKLCKKITDASCLTVGKICIARFNAGDSNGLALVGVSVKGTGSPSGAGNYSAKYCWRGQTSTACSSGGYSACNRTVCTWSAANEICTQHGWRLPTKSELAGFGSYSAALYLCDPDGSTYKCSCTMNCPGSAGGDCFVYGVWSQTKGDKYYLYSNSWIYKQVYGSEPSSVRCVRDL